MEQIIVIGGGAAGLFAAISAAESGKEVLLVEKNEKIGKKLFITGKGRCNVTNNAGIKTYIQNIYPNGKFLYHAFSTFFVEDTVIFFEDRNVPLVLERGERYFPKSGKSSDIVKALQLECNRLKINILYNTVLIKINTKNNEISSIEIESEHKKRTITTNKVILATGGLSYPLTGSSGDGYKIAHQLGHTITKTMPSLVGLIFENNFSCPINNITLKNVAATLLINGKKICSEFGEMEMSKNTLTGPIILTLSRTAVNALTNNEKVEISIDFKPALDTEQLDKRLLRDFETNSKMKFKDLLKLLFPQDLIPFFIELLNVNENKIANQITSKERKKLLNSTKDLRFKIIDNEGFNRAIITAGGIVTDEINPITMESKKIKGLFFAGEIIDLDAKTGGFNLQIAFSTGFLAGKNI